MLQSKLSPMLRAADWRSVRSPRPKRYEISFRIDSWPYCPWSTRKPVRLAFPRERRHREGRNPEAHLAEVLEEVGAAPVVGHVWRRHVVEEAAPLVLDHE
jgi:hypothetical protein